MQTKTESNHPRLNSGSQVSGQSSCAVPLGGTSAGPLPSTDGFPTRCHVEAFEKILQLGRLHFDRETCAQLQAQCGGIAPRTFPLVVGPSACGKTFIAKVLAQQLNAKLNMVSAGNWVPRGSDCKPCSMVSILEDVLSYERVVLFVDEIDKIEEITEKKDWNTSNRMDIYALLDGEGDFTKIVPLLARHNPALYERVTKKSLNVGALAKERLFIMGAGTWQQTHSAAAKHRTQLGFANVDTRDEAFNVDMQDRLKGNSLIAEELRNRFYSDVIQLRHPTKEEGQAMMERKGISALARHLGLTHLLDSIDWPNGGLRNVQSVVAQLGIAAAANTHTEETIPLL